MQAAEIELKFPVEDVASFRRQIAALGCFSLDTERTFESNTPYDTPERTLRSQTELLRIRTYGERATLTHKRTPKAEAAPVRFKTRIETETTLGDAEALAAIFGHLGYAPVFRYEKYRTEWSSGTGHLVLDETPIGIWAELEGEPEWIDSMMARLGVDPATCSTESYGKLFLRWRERTGSAVEHLTFQEIQQPALTPC
jgi:adenylate cyclase class 2